MSAKYFDFLPKYGAQIATAIGCPSADDLVRDIENMRATMREIPRYAGTEARRFAEAIVQSLINEKNKDFASVLKYAADRALIPQEYLSRFYDIKDIGNETAHHLNIIGFNKVKNGVTKLDKVFRYFISVKIDKSYPYNAKISDDQIDIAKYEKLAENTNKNIELLTNSEKSGIEEPLNETNLEAEKNKITHNKIVSLLSEIEDIEKSASDEDLKKIDEAFSKAIDSEKSIGKKYEKIDREIKEILSERDFIHHLLGRGGATNEQKKIIGLDDNTIKIKGCAGSGKTLCLIAKTIKEMQLSLLNIDREKKAIVFTFNKSLKRYISDIIENVSTQIRHIETINFDRFVDELHKQFSPSEIIYYSGKDGKKGNADYLKEVIRELGSTIAPKFQNTSYDFLNGFLEKECRWIESKEQMSREIYLQIERSGRGRKYAANKGSKERDDIYSIYENFTSKLKRDGRHLLESAIKELLLLYKNGREGLPKYDIVAIDEAQDLSIASVQLLSALKRDERSKFYIAADENQKIFSGDFSWSYIDNMKIHRGNSITLKNNLRNAEEIENFASRLLGDTNKIVSKNGLVTVAHKNIQNIIAKIATYSKENLTTLVVMPSFKTKDIKSALDATNATYFGLDESVSILRHGIYLANSYQIKGLEFDRVIAPYTNYDNSYDESSNSDKNMYYVLFTRARKELEIYYQNEPHQILTKYYADYL